MSGRQLLVLLLAVVALAVFNGCARSVVKCPFLHVAVQTEPRTVIGGSREYRPEDGWKCRYAGDRAFSERPDFDACAQKAGSVLWRIRSEPTGS